MHTMLNKLHTYARKKGLTVNTAKLEVVLFSSKSVSPLQNPLTYDGVVLPEKDRFKYLGMLLDRRIESILVYHIKCVHQISGWIS